MPKFYLHLFWLVILVAQPTLSRTQGITLERLSTYSTGIFDEGAAEIATYCSLQKRVFFVNAATRTVDVLDLNDPNKPKLLFKIELAAYGRIANSVDIANGFLAVAVENENKQLPGKVVLFDSDGNFLDSTTVGALPDGLKFSPDGKTLLVANEGEPNDDYSVDPQGSISLIRISKGKITENKLLTFVDYNDSKVSLQNQGIRFIKPDATVAQDLEPEYVSFSENGRQGYCSLQENNAIAIIDIEKGEITAIKALGTKDHYLGEPVVNELKFNEIPWWPDLGTPANGNTIKLGGFSGLFYDPVQSTEDQLSFWVVPDRGPNKAAISRNEFGTDQNLRPFLLPDYEARIHKIMYFKNSGDIHIDANPIFLKYPDNKTPISGFGNIPGVDEIPITPVDGKKYNRVDFEYDGVQYQALDFDKFGADFEGILRDKNGDFWLCDEYRPALYQFSYEGIMKNRYVPEGTAQLGNEPKEAGYYGKETLPKVYSKRRANRGFEAIAYDDKKHVVYAFIQSPLENPNSSIRNNSDIIRILGIDAETGRPVEEFVYLLENNTLPSNNIARVDKIGDAVYQGNGIFMVLERDNAVPEDNAAAKKYIFQIDIKGATNILDSTLASSEMENSLESMSADELAANGIVPVFKTKILNLPSIGYLPSDKIEGIAILPDHQLAVMNDNDFGLAGAGVSDDVSLGIISFKFNHGMDVSDRNESIEIVPRKVRGMYQPDAIKSFEYNGLNYIVSANEGDAKDYDGFSEEIRVKDLDLEPTIYPANGFFQNDENLGRLKTSIVDGDTNGDSLVDQIHAFGARSFSIWSEYGDLIYDSGEIFEKITAELLPNYFNSNGDDNLKSRSDDKGPEPEAIALGKVNDKLYAFIGMERIGGVFIFDISNPFEPVYVDYIINRNFDLAPEEDTTADIAIEDMHFITAEESPNGEPMLLVSSEVSGTVSFYSIRNKNNIHQKEVAELQIQTPNNSSFDDLRVYPNPVQNTVYLDFEVLENQQFQIVLSNTLGQTVSVLNEENAPAGRYLKQLDLTNLQNGMYYLTIYAKGETVTKKILKN